MSRWYRLLYGVGITPWESGTDALGAQLDRLVAAEEAGREPPHGAALDLGCGTGQWAVELARRGWRVTGIDVVPKAIGRARHRAQEAGVDVSFVEGDVVSLRDHGVGSGFSLVLLRGRADRTSRRRFPGRASSTRRRTTGTCLAGTDSRAPSGWTIPFEALEQRIASAMGQDFARAAR